MPEFDISEEKLEKLANSSVSKGLTVPGVQKKLSLHLETDNKTGRLTIVDYPTGYILKPQSVEYDALPEAEFLSMKLAELAGIKTVPCALLKLDDTFAYITKRIDRTRDGMLAMEDFCQLSNRITAAYDMLPVNVIMPQDKDQMALTVNGKKRNIRQKDFLILAESIGISHITAMRLISRILKLTDKMIAEVNQSYVPDYMKEDLNRLIVERGKVFGF